ncbi:retrovirus-related pol polyprotein from transposon TNT 1-94 [Tanacetum coccineum]
MNGLVLSKHLWTEAVRIACYTQNRSIIIKRHDKTPYEIFKERILDISYFNAFGCHVFIHNHKDHLGKFEAKANDGYFLGYSFVSKAFRVFNTRRQHVKEAYHVTFDKSMEAIRFTNILVDEFGINESSRYPPDEYLHEDGPSRQYQGNSDISYYITPHNRSLTELIKITHVPEVITPNEQNTPLIEDTEGPPDLINTEGTHEQTVQNEQNNNQLSEVPSGVITRKNLVHEHLSTSSNLFSPLRDPESLIGRRNLGEPSSLFDFEETMSIPHDNQGPPPAGPPPQNNNGPPPVVRPNGLAPDLRSMKELCQPSINGRGGPIAPIPIQATDFGLHHHMIQQV